MYEFTEDCLIHIDEIDDEHRRLFQMLNEAIQLADESADVTPVANNLIANLKDYVSFCMNRRCYPFLFIRECKHHHDLVFHFSQPETNSRLIRWPSIISNYVYKPLG